MARYVVVVSADDLREKATYVASMDTRKQIAGKKKRIPASALKDTSQRMAVKLVVLLLDVKQKVKYNYAALQTMNQLS